MDIVKARVITPYVWSNTRTCIACWKCIDECPKGVIGKVQFLWHKHIVFKDSENCTGCKKCIKTCPNNVFREI
ncbi:MAG: 4Fe-4S binding protein [Tannerellaceae bacterium]|nr:4Fe-4S binding protein [Tannerellaceae bacterium]